MSDKNLWNHENFSEQELEDLAVIQQLTLVYGLGYIESEKKFKLINGPWFTTDEMTIHDTVVFLRSFESRYKDEIWFRRSDYEGRKAIIRRRVQSGDGARGPEVGSVDGPDNK